MAICIDTSQMKGLFRGLYTPHFSFKDHDLVVCCFCLAVVFLLGCFEGFKTIPSKSV